MKNNMFTTKLHEIIHDPDCEGNYLFLVMEYIESDLKKVFNTS
jgi:hypothetical protein